MADQAQTKLFKWAAKAEYVKSTHPFKLQVEKTLQLYKSLLSNLKGSPNLRTG
jgi:hypothetical protein